MYFIAFFIGPQISVIIPKSWILDIDENWEKFVNHSLNRNQKFVCFFSKQANAMTTGHQILISYRISLFHKMLPSLLKVVTSQNYAFIKVSIFYNKILFMLLLEMLYVFKKKYSIESFDDALKLLGRRRNVAPGLYNDDRLNESPIPRPTPNTNRRANWRSANSDANDSNANTTAGQFAIDFTAPNQLSLAGNRSGSQNDSASSIHNESDSDRETDTSAVY